MRCLNGLSKIAVKAFVVAIPVLLCLVIAHRGFNLLYTIRGLGRITMAYIFKKPRVLAYQPISMTQKKSQKGLLAKSPTRGLETVFLRRFSFHHLSRNSLEHCRFFCFFQVYIQASLGDYATGFRTESGEYFNLGALILDSLPNLYS
jgi:hypothetical protein